MIEWITSDMASKAVEAGEESALECSIQKWRNYSSCQQEEYDKCGNDTWITDFQSCALCIMYQNKKNNHSCDLCPLRIKTGLDCYSKDSFYDRAFKIFQAYRRRRTEANFKLSQQSATAMLNVLLSLREV